MNQTTKLLEKILNPDEEFTAIPFWFFNDLPDEKKIAAQLSDYVEKGVHGIVLHPRIGIPETIPYLSEAFFDAVRCVLRTAAELNMKIVLYDEAMYPSGSAHGLVVAQNHEFASKGIRLTDEPGTDKVVAKLQNGQYLVYGFTGGTIRGIHFGEDDGEAQAPLSADILNPQAVDTFIQLTHERYYHELKSYFGTTIIGFFTDEPSALGRNAGSYQEWADGLEDEIESVGGNLEELAGLFYSKENDTTKIYHKLIKKRLRETFYRPLSEWCETHGIVLMGHPELSDDVEEELFFHIPGQDLIMRRVVPLTGGLLEFDSVQAKLPADIARHIGRKRNANECFGVCNRDGIPWYFTGAEMKWYLDWMAVRGVNLFVPHAFYYSIKGRRKDERPPDVGPNNIWWSHYRRYSDYMKRLSFLMTDSKNGSRVAVLCDNNCVPYLEVAGLYEQQIEFNYLPAALLKDCTVEEGCVCIRGYRYDVVLDIWGMADRQNETWKAVTVVRSVEEILSRSELKTLWTDKRCEKLRVVQLTRDGTQMYLLSNEGDQTIQTTITFHSRVKPFIVDLWQGCCYDCDATAAGEMVSTALMLAPCETLLYVMAKTNDCEPYKRIAKDSLGNWTERFTLVSREQNQAVYEYTFFQSSISGGECFWIDGEEMAECYCNDRFADVSFWSPHRLNIGSFLREGENTLKLVMTGNAANVYSGAEIFYGLSRKEQV